MGGEEEGKSGRTSKAAIRRLTHLLDFYFHEFNVCHNRYLLHVLETQHGPSKFTLDQLGEFPRIHRILSGLDRKTTLQLLRSAVETLNHLSVDDSGALVLCPKHRPEVPKFVGVPGFDAEALVRSPVVLHDHGPGGRGQAPGPSNFEPGMATVQHSNEHLPADVFTVLGYNVLADIHARPELFPHCTNDDLKWSQRRAKLKREIIYHHADVVCLHDLQSDRDEPGLSKSDDDHLAYFSEALAEAAYGGQLYKRRRPAPGSSTAELETGSAIFWDSTRMEPLRQWSWSLSEDADLLSEYREVAVCALLKHRTTQKPVLVCASRFSNSQSEDVLAWQAHALLRRLARIRDALVVPVPVVVSVDMNAGADSAAYRAISQGLLDFEEPTVVPSSLAPAAAGRKAEAYAKFSQRADRLFEELEQCQLIPRPARQSHKHATFHPSLPLQDVYAAVMQKPPPFSVYTQREQRLRDHMFSTGVVAMAVLAGVYAHIEQKHRGMPCSRFPSSHLPLIAAFRML